MRCPVHDFDVFHDLRKRTYRRYACTQLLQLLWLLHELRAYAAYSGCGGELMYWRTPAGTEIDFIWTRGARAVGIETKASNRWRHEDSGPLEELLRTKVISRAAAVYLGDRRLKDGGVDVLPIEEFLLELEAGKIIG